MEQFAVDLEMWCALRSPDDNSRERRTPVEAALKRVIQAEGSAGSRQSWKLHWTLVKSQCLGWY